jgi:hypothetical protein
MGGGALVAARTSLWIDVKRQGFPKDRFQLLCHNCNMGKHMNGGICPHQQKRAMAAD